MVPSNSVNSTSSPCFRSSANALACLCPRQRRWYCRRLSRPSPRASSLPIVRIDRNLCGGAEWERFWLDLPNFIERGECCIERYVWFQGVYAFSPSGIRVSWSFAQNIQRRCQSLQFRHVLRPQVVSHKSDIVPIAADGLMKTISKTLWRVGNDSAIGRARVGYRTDSTYGIYRYPIRNVMSLNPKHAECIEHQWLRIKAEKCGKGYKACFIRKLQLRWRYIFSTTQMTRNLMISSL